MAQDRELAEQRKAIEERRERLHHLSQWVREDIQEYLDMFTGNMKD